MAIVSGIARVTVKWLAITTIAIGGLFALWSAVYDSLSIVGHIQ
jgi:hypothetical protein